MFRSQTRPHHHYRRDVESAYSEYPQSYRNLRQLSKVVRCQKHMAITSKYGVVTALVDHVSGNDHRVTEKYQPNNIYPCRVDKNPTKA